MQYIADSDQQIKKIKKDWNGLESLSVGIIAFIFAQISMAIFMVLSSIISFSGTSSRSFINDNLLQQNWYNLVLLAVADIVLLLVIRLFLKNKKISIKKLGLSRPKIIQFLYVPVVAFVYFMILIFVMFLAPHIIPGLNIEQEQDIGFVSTENWQIILAFIGLVIITPFTEEVFFRGFLYQGLRNYTQNYIYPIFGLTLAAFSMFVFEKEAVALIAILTLLSAILVESRPKIAAAVFTSMIFAVAHGQWNVAIDTFILSFALIWLLEKTGNIWASVALHALKNFIALMAIFVIGVN